MVENLADDKARWDDWMEHIRTVFPSIRNVRSVSRDEDRKDYLMIRYANGAEVPAWGVSEGTTAAVGVDDPRLSTGRATRRVSSEEPENGHTPDGD